MSPKVRVNDFDPDVCEDCPHRLEPGESSGNTAVDALAEAENQVLGAVKGEKQPKCGLCGCPLINLELVGRAPESCPRIDEHGGELL